MTTQNTLMQANREWSSRPEDQRFLSLTALAAFTATARQRSAAKVLNTRQIEVCPVTGDETRGLAVVGPNGSPVTMTNWSFGQVAQRAGAPAAYLRTLPAPLVADAMNYGLRSRDVEDVGILLRREDDGVARLAAMTGPGYGRVWNSDIAQALVQRFGDGITGAFRVPGEFGKRVEVTKANTTIYASDRDMFVFLADEDHRIEMPNRRDGQPGSLARGFFVWNSEVGSATFGIGTFLFDYVCCNRIVWGAEEYREIRIRHTASAPARWIEEVAPAISRYAESSTASITKALEAARSMKLTGGLANESAVTDFLSKRFTRSQAKAIEAAHLADEGRPIETLWDAVTGATAYARGIGFQNERVEIEREAGKMLDAAA